MPCPGAEAPIVLRDLRPPEAISEGVQPKAKSDQSHLAAFWKGLPVLLVRCRDTASSCETSGFLVRASTGLRVAARAGQCWDCLLGSPVGRSLRAPVVASLHFTLHKPTLQKIVFCKDMQSQVKRSLCKGAGGLWAGVERVCVCETVPREPLVFAGGAP